VAEHRGRAQPPPPAHGKQAEAAPPCGGAEPQKPGLAASAHAREEAGGGVLEPLERPASHVDRIGSVDVRVIRSDDGEAILLVEAGDGLASRRSCRARAAAQALSQEPSLSSGRMELLPIGQDHAAKSGTKREHVNPLWPISSPK
jgi:hypothetical protein